MTIGNKPNAVHLRKISVRPALVGGLWVSGWWFDFPKEKYWSLNPSCGGKGKGFSS